MAPAAAADAMEVGSFSFGSADPHDATEAMRIGTILDFAARENDYSILCEALARLRGHS